MTFYEGIKPYFCVRALITMNTSLFVTALRSIVCRLILNTTATYVLET